MFTKKRLTAPRQWGKCKLCVQWVSRATRDGIEVGSLGRPYTLHLFSLWDLVITCSSQDLIVSNVSLILETHVKLYSLNIQTTHLQKWLQVSLFAKCWTADLLPAMGWIRRFDIPEVNLKTSVLTDCQVTVLQPYWILVTCMQVFHWTHSPTLLYWPPALPGHCQLQPAQDWSIPPALLTGQCQGPQSHPAQEGQVGWADL